MKKRKIKFRDPVVEAVVDKFVSRSDVGFKKYGKTLRDDKSNMSEWLNHIQEELMDAVLYIQRAKEEIEKVNCAKKRIIPTQPGTSSTIGSPFRAITSPSGDINWITNY